MKKNSLIVYCSALFIIAGFFPRLSLAQSAIHQLEIITGQTIDSYQYQVNGPDYSGSSSSSSAPALLSEENNAVITDVLLTHANEVNNRGVRSYNKGDWAGAVRDFKTALKYDPNNSVFQQNLRNAEEKLQAKQSEENAKKEYIREGVAFVKSFNTEVKSYAKDQKKLKKQLASYVPPLTQRKVIKEGVILGMSNTRSHNAIAKYDLKSPFSGEKVPYYATSDDASWRDLARVTLDNLTVGKYTTLHTETGKELVQQLGNTYFETLMAHSNGATVTEALLRADVIKAKELHIMGGDRSLTNYSGYCDLVAQGKVEKVVVWLNPADYVPYGTSLADLFVSRSYNKHYQTENFDQFCEHTLKSLAGSKNVEYRWLSGPEFTQKGQDFKLGSETFDAHGLEVYWENIRRYREKYGDRMRDFTYKRGE